MKDVHQAITDQIVALLESGTKPWECPWIRENKGAAWPINYKTKARYSGYNVLAFWITSQAEGYSANAWLTFKQAKELGGHVRKGAKATLGVFYKPIRKEVQPGDRYYPKDGDGEPVMLEIPCLKPFYAFNLDQLEGIEREALPVQLEDFQANAAAEAFIQGSGARIEEGGEHACYVRSRDVIQIPDRQRFTREAAFYATVCHELVHWTGHESRLGREFGKRFGDAAYAFEELVADIGAAFIGADLGLSGQIEHHASYLDHWLTILKADNKAIVKAASLAAKAHEYLMDVGTARETMAA